MARPRKYVQINGQTIDGVGYHRPTGRYYIINQAGQRVYFGMWQEARDAYRRQQGDPVAIAKLEAEYVLRHAAMKRPEFFARLTQIYGGNPQLARTEILHSALEARRRNPDGSLAPDDSDITPLADRAGAPRFRMIEIAAESDAADVEERTVSAANPRLVELGEEWLRARLGEKGREYVAPGVRKGMKRSPLTQHMRDTLARWRMFVDVVGDVRLGEVRAEHFRRFRSWADKEGSKRTTGRWHQQLLTAVKTVFRLCQRQYPDWQWPASLGLRLEACPPKRYRPAESNAEPMPPEVFGRLIDQCAAWAAMDPGKYGSDTQADRAMRVQAARKRRQGVQFALILRLALNCGLNGVDIARLRWSNLQLDNPVPHLELPRQKVAHSAGRAIERRTPLISSVVSGVRAYRDQEASCTSDGYVFHTPRGTPLSSSVISRAVGQLLAECGLDNRCTLRHLRNVGPTLAANAGLPEEMIDRFLGHAPRATSRFYRGRPPLDYLRPVVELIAAQYNV